MQTTILAKLTLTTALLFFVSLESAPAQQATVRLEVGGESHKVHILPPPPTGIASASSAQPLKFHGGPVMTTVKTYSTSDSQEWVI